MRLPTQAPDPGTPDPGTPDPWTPRTPDPAPRTRGLPDPHTPHPRIPAPAYLEPRTPARRPYPQEFRAGDDGDPQAGDQMRDAHATHSVAAGRASSRAAGIGSPHDAQMP